MHEYAAEDDEENQGQYEFPEVEKALPECIRKTLKRDYREGKVRDRALSRRHRKGQFKDWIGRLRRIDDEKRSVISSAVEAEKEAYGRRKAQVPSGE